MSLNQSRSLFTILCILFLSLLLIPTASAQSACTLGSSSWISTPLSASQTGTFGISFDVTPQANGVDADVALSQNQPASYTDLAAVLRFNPSGYIDVRNGSAYSAAYTQPYTANATYHFSAVVNVPSHVYSVYVTPPGGTQQLLASNYAFRTEQANASSLNYWITYKDPFSASALQVCNFAVSAVTVSVSPTSASLQPGATQQFTPGVTGTTNTAVTWTLNGGSITSSGLYTAPATAGTYTVKATSVADTTKSASATVTVTALPPPVAVAISPTTASIQTGATQQFTSTVTGSTNTAVTWTATGGTISSSGLYTAPATAGTYTVKATSVADSTKSASSTVTVTAAAAQIAISPTSLGFGSIVAGTTSTKTVQISNTGGTAMSVTNATVTGSGFSLVGATFPISIPAGQSVNLSVKFAPTAAGTFSGSLTTTSNASNTAPTVALSGTATTAATFLLSAAPTSVSFGSVVVGLSTTQTVTLSNTGTGSVTVSAANVSGSGFSATGLTLPFSIAAGTTSPVTLTFAPGVSGTASGSVSFVSTATNSPATASLSGTGVAPLPHSTDLSWNASTSPVIGYFVYRGTVSGGPYTKLDSSAQAGTTYTDSTVQSGFTYYYVVTAVDTSGSESSFSNQAIATIPTP